jgi:type IV pilus assembly protein PilA
LIELMIVVAIIGILAAIAIPAYQDYTIRTQISEGLNIAGEAKNALSDYYANIGRFPNGAAVSPNTSVGLPSAGSIVGNYVAGVTIADDGTGNIHVEYGHQINANVTVGATSGLILWPLTVQNSPTSPITWLCGYAPNPAPGTLNTPAATAGTTVLTKWLPSDCRP